MIEIIKDQLAFDGEEGGLRFVAWYLVNPNGEALVEITRDGKVVKTFLWPAYKVWNVAAHASDIAADLNEGLAIAGSDGLDG